jgi:large subunit ribosomal protein L4
MNAIILDNKFANGKEQALPESFDGINAHNLWLAVKSFQAAERSNTASTKTRSDVSGGGKKPFAQKGGGRARAGSTRSPVWVGGGVAFGSKNNRNYDLKVNKKQKKLALKYALAEHAKNGSLFVVDSLAIASGKTKDAAAVVETLNQRDILLVSTLIDQQTDNAYRNIRSCYLIQGEELDAYHAAAYRSIMIEKAVFDKLVEA